MAQFTETDVILRFDYAYDLCIDFESHHDVILDDSERLDLTVDGMSLLSDLYGDELRPIIMHLVTGADVTLHVILLATSIHDLDDELLMTLDPYLLSGLDEYVKHRDVMRLVTGADLSTTLVIPVEGQELRLLAQATPAALQEYVALKQGQLALKSSASVTTESKITLKAGSVFYLSDEMNQVVRLELYLTSDERSLMIPDPELLTDLDNIPLTTLDYIDHTIALTNNPIGVDTELSFDMASFNLPLAVSMDELYQQSQVKLDSENVMYLTEAAVDVQRLQAVGDGAFGLPMKIGAEIVAESPLGDADNDLALRTGLDYQEFLMDYDDNMFTDMDSETIAALDGGDGQIHLEAYTDVNDGMTLDAAAVAVICDITLKFYDDDLLMSYDDYTLIEMEDLQK